MAALLPHGAPARRLAGSMIQRAQAEERRRLGLGPTRLMHTEEKVGNQNLFDASGGIACEIQRRKDELYDLIIRRDKDAMTRSWRDAWLLMHLSEVVTPRPSDCEWLNLKSSRVLIRGFKKVGFFSLSFLAMNYYNSTDRQVAPAMNVDGRRA
uniref:Uncharacterized protein n=1 Tax=Avena sativa TaxID=4498 RepID=A0ACD5TZL6_AVESA